MPDLIDEYRRRAEECERLAKEAASPEHEQIILGIAASWREMADQRDKMLKIRQENGRPLSDGRDSSSPRG